MGGVENLRSALPEAIERFSRLRASAATSEQMQEHERWLAASAAHREAFDQVADQWDAINAIRGRTDMLFMREAACRNLRWRQFARMAYGAVAASVVGLAVIGASLVPSTYNSYLEHKARADALTYRTSVGQISTVRLADGTVATLDTDTVIRTWQVKHGRFVDLARGRARFKVAKDPSRPFAVLANGRSVTAVGTDFDVYLRPNGLRVTLVEGRLRVKTEGQGQSQPSIDMTAGYQLTAGAGGMALARADAVANLSWTTEQLTFDDKTLLEIAEELNRYSSRKIIIRDPKVARLKMSAVVKNHDVRSFLNAVEEFSFAKVRLVGEGYELTAAAD